MKKMLLTGVALGLGLAFASAASAQIKIGVAGPITGPNAAFGAQLKNGAEQAVEDINAAGGINGQKLQLVVGDDVSDPKQGVSVANKFAGRRREVGRRPLQLRRVDPGLGGLSRKPASSRSRRPRPTRSSPSAACGTPSAPAAATTSRALVAGSYLADKFKGKKVAVVHDKTPYGKGLADETQKAMNAKGLKEVVYEGVNPGEKDYSALVSKLKQAGVDVVYFGGLHTEAGLIIRQMRDQGLKAPMMSRRRHRVGRVRLDRRPRRRRHADDLLARIRARTRTPRTSSRSSRPRTSSRRPTRSTPTRRSRSSPQAAEAGWQSTDAQEDGRRHARRASRSRP